MINLYKKGLSSEFIFLGFIRLKNLDELMIYCIIKLKKHKTFNEYYHENYSSNSNSEIKKNILNDKKIKSMFLRLFEKCNNINYYIMHDFHLNNVVMSLDEKEILVIDYIPEINGNEKIH